MSLRSALRILQETSDAVLDAKRVARGDAGSLTLGFTAASSYVFLPRLMALIQQAMPGVELTVREMATPQQRSALEAGQIDIGLMRPVVARGWLRSRHVYRENLVLAVAQPHRLADMSGVALGELAGEMLITYPPFDGPEFHQLIMGLLNVAGVIPGSV